MRRSPVIGAVASALVLAAPAAATASAGAALQHEINGVLDRALGPHRAYVVADVVTNRNRVSAQRLTYGTRGTALQSQSASAAGGGYRRRAGATTWAHDERLTTTVSAPGGVRRIQLTLVADVKLPRRTVSRLRRMVASLAGLNRARGDRITVARMRLATAAATPRPSGPAALLAAARHAPRAGLGALLALGVLAFLLFARRDIRRGRAAS